MDLSAYYEEEDRLASRLTAQKVREISEKLLQGIRECLQQRPRDVKKAQCFALQLRQLNRHSNYRLKKLKDKLNEVRTDAEQSALAQNNLSSEISHIKRSIAACLDFQSLDQELDLVSLEEFKQKAPEVMEITEEILQDEHKLYLARLNYEIHQRNAMVESLQELEGLRNVLASDISGKEHRLKQVDPIVARLQDTTKELLELLGVP
ncbi:unnamed protein product [Bursaphelenchus xylophilus]|uniref:(pine wood nematode) hypothetical protein n=1 Tax=Bursaphelenchus xylophilus TaxID=6326 RepID=A0A1I7SX36_BURXY|nr:unnamed protein product [Bursaphelenchus xylophilus]CAG9100148.1 unnamed protein product [Bursaphelenchus xylophilus]